MVIAAGETVSNENIRDQSISRESASTEEAPLAPALQKLGDDLDAVHLLLLFPLLLFSQQHRPPQLFLKWEKFATDFYHVFSPTGAHYVVLLNEEVMPACDCPAFAKYNECKHHLAIDWMVRDEAQADAFDAMMASGETEGGCDPYARF